MEHTLLPFPANNSVCNNPNIPFLLLTNLEFAFASSRSFSTSSFENWIFTGDMFDFFLRSVRPRGTFLLGPTAMWSFSGSTGFPYSSTSRVRTTVPGFGTPAPTSFAAGSRHAILFGGVNNCLLMVVRSGRKGVTTTGRYTMSGSTSAAVELLNTEDT